MNQGKVRQFIRKYRFPIHLIVLRDVVVRNLLVVFCTAWSRFLFLLHGCQVGPGLTVDGRLIIRTAAKGGISIGRNFNVNARQLSNLVGLTSTPILNCIGNGKIVIGDYSGMSGAILSSRAEIRIGNYVNIGGNVRIFDHDFHSMSAMDRRNPAIDKRNCRAEPVVIEDDVFIGANTIILKGVHIGERSIVGAGSVVTMRDIPADSVVAGNPARLISTKPAG